jgi:hypothetical protein
MDEEERFSNAQQYFVEEPTALFDIAINEQRDD